MKNQLLPSRIRSESIGGEHPGPICAETWFLLLSRKWATNMRHSSIYKLSKVEERTLRFEEKFGEGWDPVAKTTRKEIASGAASKRAGGGTIIGIFTGYRSG